MLTVHTAVARRTNPLQPSPRSAGSDIPVRCRERAAMMPHFTVRRPGVQTTLLLYDLDAILEQNTCRNITSGQLKHQAADSEQSYHTQLCRLHIDRVRLLNNCLVRFSFAANQQVVFKVPASFDCISYVLANYLRGRSVDVLTC